LHVKESGSFVATFEGGTDAYTYWVNSTGGVGYIGSASGLGSGGITDLAVRSENNLIFLTNAGSERMRISSSGKVGINTTTMQSTFNVQGVDGNIANFSFPAAATELKVVCPTVNVIGLHTGTDDNFIFGTNSTERMRLDATGNLLVGTTNGNPTGNHEPGTLIFAGGQINVHRDGGNPARFGSSVDGNLTEYYKQGAHVGSIGVGGSSAQPTIGSNNTVSGGTAAGLRFDRANNAIEPWNVITNALADSTIDLGYPTIRFKDLYLSGGIQFDSRSNKLDDYEEGTFTLNLHLPPDSLTNAHSTQNNRYVKIGSQVWIQGKILLSAGSSSSSTLRCSGLPFTTSSGTASTGSMISRYGASFDFVPYVFSNSAEVHFYQISTTGNWNQVQYSELAGSFECHFNITYIAA
jgi:hypothetical protein